MDGSDRDTQIRATTAHSTRVFGWCIAAGLVILVAVLGAVLLNAGLKVEVLP